jgi:hypothetical protein
MVVSVKNGSGVDRSVAKLEALLLFCVGTVVLQRQFYAASVSNVSLGISEAFAQVG